MAKQRYKMNMIDGRRDKGFTDLKIYNLKILVTFLTFHSSLFTLHSSRSSPPLGEDGRGL
jgi:hypothetical protein